MWGIILIGVSYFAVIATALSGNPQALEAARKISCNDVVFLISSYCIISNLEKIAKELKRKNDKEEQTND